MKRTQTQHTLVNCYFVLQDFDTDAFDAFCVIVCEDAYEAEVGMASADLGIAHMPSGVQFLDVKKNSNSVLFCGD